MRNAANTLVRMAILGLFSFTAAASIGVVSAGEDSDQIFLNGFEEGATPIEGAYYVSASRGNNSNPGTLSSPWKTIGKAVASSSPVEPNGVVYVEAGTYNEQVTVGKNNISLIGYKATPGDQPPILANRSIEPTSLGNGYPYDPADMPLLDGGNRGSGTGIDLRGRKNVTIRNFSIRNYKNGIDAGSSSSSFVEAHNLDNISVSNVGSFGSYGGMAISLGQIWPRVYSNGNTLRNLLLINAASEGLKIFGDGNDVDNVRVYSYELSNNSTDYYLVVLGNNNHINHGYIWRRPFSGHRGHGFTIKDTADQPRGAARLPSENNLFENLEAHNMSGSFVARHRGVRNNTFRNGIAHGQHGNDETCHGTTSTGYSEPNEGVTVRDGASYNRFENIDVYDVCNAVRFVDTDEDNELTDLPREPAGNVIDGLTAARSATALAYDYDPVSGPTAIGAGNEIRNATFSVADYFINADRPNSAMHYYDCAFADIPDPGWGGFMDNVRSSQFTDCTFTNVALPGGF